MAPDARAGEGPFALALALDVDHTERPVRRDRLVADARFRRGVALLGRRGLSVRQLLERAREVGGVAACMALEVVAGRTAATSATDWILEHLASLPVAAREFLLHALDAHASGPVVARVLLGVDATWEDDPSLDALKRFLAARRDREPSPTFGTLLADVTDPRLDALETRVDALRDVLPATLVAEVAARRARLAAIEFLGTVGRVWEAPPDEDEAMLGVPALRAAARELEAKIAARRSVLAVGDPGVGKTTLLRHAARRLHAAGWIVFEATGADLLAGQIYIGQIEERVQTLVRRIGGERVLWLHPAFEELQWAGRHRYSPGRLLDLLLPHLATEALIIAGELRPAAWEAMALARPGMRTIVEPCRLDPTDDAGTLTLGQEWAARHALADGRPALAASDLREALELGRQFLSGRAAPGNLLAFLDRAHRRLAAAPMPLTRPIERADLLATLSELTGLPLGVLDDRQALDVAALRSPTRRPRAGWRGCGSRPPPRWAPRRRPGRSSAGTARRPRRSCGTACGSGARGGSSSSSTATST